MREARDLLPRVPGDVIAYAVTRSRIRPRGIAGKMPGRGLEAHATRQAGCRHHNRSGRQEGQVREARDRLPVDRVHDRVTRRSEPLTFCDGGLWLLDTDEDPTAS